MSEKQVTFTLGPWENASVGIESSATQVVWLGENTDKRIQVIGTGKDKENARLIAAAPELFEQCKLFEKLLSTLIMEGHSGADLERDNLQAILNKVEGESA